MFQLLAAIINVVINTFNVKFLSILFTDITIDILAVNNNRLITKKNIFFNLKNHKFAKML